MNCKNSLEQNLPPHLKSVAHYLVIIECSAAQLSFSFVLARIMYTADVNIILE